VYPAKGSDGKAAKADPLQTEQGWADFTAGWLVGGTAVGGIAVVDGSGRRTTITITATSRSTTTATAAAAAIARMRWRLRRVAVRLRGRDLPAIA
jgi:hypothetical protein